MKLFQSKKFWIIFSCCMAGMLCLIAAISCLVYLFFFNPKARVTRAITATLRDYDTSLQEYIDIGELSDLIKEGRYQQYLTLKLTDLSVADSDNKMTDMIIGASLDMDYALDQPAHRMNTEYALHMGGSTLLRSSISLEDDLCAIGLGDLLDGVFTFHTETLGKDYHNSDLSGMINIPLEDDFGYNYFDVIQAQLDRPMFYESYATDLGQVYQSIRVEKSTETMELLIKDKNRLCRGYQVTLPAASVDLLLQDYLSYAKDVYEAYEATDSSYDWESVYERCTGLIQDYTFTLYLYGGKMVNLQLDTNIEENETSHEINLNMTFLTGKAYSADQLNGDLLVDGIAATYRQTFTPGTGKLDIDLAYAADTEDSVTLHILGQLESGKTNTFSDQLFSFYLEEASFAIADKEALYIACSGEYDIAPLDVEITQPVQTEYSVFDMNDREWIAVLTKIGGNLSSSALGSLLGN